MKPKCPRCKKRRGIEDVTITFDGVPEKYQHFTCPRCKCIYRRVDTYAKSRKAKR